MLTTVQTVAVFHGIRFHLVNPCSVSALLTSTDVFHEWCQFVYTTRCSCTRPCFPLRLSLIVITEADCPWLCSVYGAWRLGWISTISCWGQGLSLSQGTYRNHGVFPSKFSDLNCSHFICCVMTSCKLPLQIGLVIPSWPPPPPRTQLGHYRLV